MKPGMQEAIEAVATWWASHLEVPPGRNNGEADPTRTGIALLSAMLVPRATADQIAYFKEALIDILTSKGERSDWVSTGVDYHPDPILAAALKAAGLRGDALPWKSNTDIQPEGKGFVAKAKSGHGSPIVQIWPRDT